jgi:hypothetical protein
MGMNLVVRKGLTAPDGFWRLHPKDYKRICNGMGPKGFGWLVPDTMWGLNVSRAGDIHDFMYYWGLWPREFCDKLFLRNILAIINKKGGKLAPLRRVRAHTYYKAVSLFGASSYSWRNKKGE